MSIAPQFFSLDQCEVAPENPRFGRDPRDLDALAATIEARGILQPLIGYQEGGKVFICAGARRLAAIAMLTVEGRAPAAFETDGIPIRIVAKEDAAAIGLIEQSQRNALHPAEEARAYAACVAKDQNPAEIAKAFGVKEVFVRQRLKLSTLHPPIFDAFLASEITIDVAAAFAAGGETKQKAAWEKLGKDATPWQIRKQYEAGALPGDDPIAIFVGEAAYLAAGGSIDADLFKDEHGGYWLEPAKAETLAMDKLRRRAEELKAEGWSFVDPRIESDIQAYSYSSRERPEKIKPTAEQQARLDAINARLEALEEIDYAPGGAGLTDAQEEEQTRLTAEEEAITESLLAYTPKQKAKSGVEITISQTGEFEYRRGLHLKEAEAKKQHAVAKATAKANGQPAPEPIEKPEPEPRATNLTHDALTRTAGNIVAYAIAKNPRAALIVVTAHLARARFGFGNIREDWGQISDSPVALKIAEAPNGAGAFTLPLADSEMKAAEDTYHKELSPHAKDLEAFLSEKADAYTESLFAFLVAPLIRCIETHPENYVNKKRRTIFGAIAQLAGADPEFYSPTAEDLKGFNRPALEDFAAEIKLDIPAKTKNSGLAELVAAKAKDIGWQPPFLRELLGAPKFKLSGLDPAKNTKAAKAGKPAKAKTAKAAKKPGKKAAPKKPPTTSASGRVLKIKKADLPSIEDQRAAKPKKRGPGRPSKAEIAAREAAE